MDTKQFRILIVEDVQDDAELVQRQMAASGLDVSSLWVDNEVDFRKHADEEWDAILCDYTMPSFGAHRVLQIVAELKINTPVIIVSGTVGEETAIEAMHYGAADYLMKDRLTRLGAAIEQAVARHRLRAAKQRAELALAESERRLKAIVENEPECVKVVSAEGLVTEMNPAGLRMIEASSRGEVIGKPLARLLHPDDVGPYFQLHRKVLSGHSGTLEFRVIGLKGTLRWMETHSVPMRDDHKSVSVLSITRDITERREAEARFRQLADNIREVFWLIDASTSEVLYASRAFEEIWGYNAEALYRDPDLWLKAIHPDDRREVLMRMGDKASEHAFDCEYRIIRPDQSQRWIRSRAFPVRNEQGVVYRIAGIAEDVTERRRAEEELRYRAMFDPLTGLPNRRTFEQRIEQAIGSGRDTARSLSLLILDLDRFKEINDTLGHAAGDQVLKRIAERLRNVAPASENASRLFGATFALLLTDTQDGTAPVDVAQRILDMFAEPLVIDEQEYFVNLSIGIASHPDHATGATDLLRKADSAMCHAKQQGSGGYQVFDAALHAVSLENLALEAGLRRGIERGEFLLHYQPRIATETGVVVGAEALLRWAHPQMGMVPPDRFIALAERTGQIIPLGDWVLREALNQLRAWDSAGLPGLDISVNVSARQLRHPDFDRRVARLLKETGIDARRLELEVTESALMHDIDETSALLGRIGALGVRIAIDDFGTGYSSLSYIKRLPIQKLKIDKSFIRDLSTDSDDAAIVTAILSMAASLNLVVTAEGVETTEQLAFLSGRKCPEYQGYLACKPVPEKSFQGFARPRRTASSAGRTSTRAARHTSRAPTEGAATGKTRS
ncbi:EAL domain-containing protein [Thioalkalivibrio denitrificans]|nr:EAL domain-containing protein [Thioalkalivibrio denitrificans]